MQWRTLKIIILGLIFTVLCFGNQTARADAEPEFIAKIKEINDQSLVVEVTNRQLSKYEVGRVLTLTILEDVIYKNAANKVISAKSFTKGLLVAIEPTTLPTGEVRANVIKMVR